MIRYIAVHDAYYDGYWPLRIDGTTDANDSPVATFATLADAYVALAEAGINSPSEWLSWPVDIPDATE